MLVFAALALAPFTTFGADTNAAGTWKWSFDGQNGDTIRTILKVKQDGDKLTGSYTNQFGQAEITDGSLKDGEISFKVKRELNGQPFILKYSGKLSGDKITGKCEFDVNGDTRALEWEAKRDTANQRQFSLEAWYTCSAVVKVGTTPKVFSIGRKSHEQRVMLSIIRRLRRAQKLRYCLSLRSPSARSQETGDHVSQICGQEVECGVLARVPPVGVLYEFDKAGAFFREQRYQDFRKAVTEFIGFAGDVERDASPKSLK